MPSTPLLPLGWSDRWAALFADAAGPSGRPGRVVRHDGTALLVAMAGDTRHLPVRATVEAPTVGDWVVVEDGAVRAVLPRSSLLCRRDPGSGNDQPMAANVDLVLVVCGLDRPVKAGRIARTAALAWDAGAVPAVVLTKADRATDPEEAHRAAAAASPGLHVLLTSTVSGLGLDALAALASGRSVVLVGESGAGKSSLANALLGEPAAATGPVRAGDAKGRHTTTARQLMALPAGGVLIDTPGIRSVGLWGSAEAVDATFPDLDEAAVRCRFSDCGHDGEPGCAVARAVADGRLAPDRVERWRSLRREAEAAQRRASDHERRRHEKRLSKLVKGAKRRKGLH